MDSAEASRRPANLVRISVPEDAGPVLQNVAALLAMQISQRSDAKVALTGDAPLKVHLAIEPGTGAEGFRIADGPKGTVRIDGGDERGVLYGGGRFLRTSSYRSGFTPGTWRGRSAPHCPVRAIYLATHFSNFYEAAPAEEVERYVAELALWGYNTILIHFPTWQFDGLSDAAAQGWLGRFKALFARAKQLGLSVGLLQAPNQGYRTTPAELRGVKVPGSRRGNFGVNLCASKPEPRRALLRTYEELLDEFTDVGLDYFALWPYDEGGCACERCWPWGARGFLSISRELVGLARARFDGCKTILSTWCFENEDDANPDGEWGGLARALSEDKGWVDYVMVDGHGDYFPKYLLEEGVPGGLPLLNFPEISMFGMTPWGGYGANPAPAHFQALWNHIKHVAAGGAPYSEGIYEDLNKALWAQFYWDPERRAEDTVKEYLAYESAPEYAEDLLEVVRIFESNHRRDHIGPSAADAFKIVESVDGRLTSQARESWRWRVLYLRALIDRELSWHEGRLEGEPLKEAFAELTRIYYAQNAGPMPLKPPEVK